MSKKYDNEDNLPIATAVPVHEAAAARADSLYVVELPVGVHPRHGNLVLRAKFDDQSLEATNLVARGHLSLEIAETEHADVGLVLVLHVGTLIGDGTSLPDTA